MVFLSRECGVRADSINQLEDLIVVAMEESQQEEVQRRCQRRSEHEGKRDMHRVDVVFRIQGVVPFLVGSIQHQLRRKWSRSDKRPTRMNRRHQNENLFVLIGQQEGMRNASDQAGCQVASLVGDEEVDVINRVESRDSLAINLGSERHLQTRKLDEIDVEILGALRIQSLKKFLC